MKIIFRDRPVIFIDLEASGLHKESYPIEIGWSSDDEQEPDSFLVRPAPNWRWEDFSQQAFAIHKIAYEALCKDGIAIDAASNRLEAAWRGAILVSDNPFWDGKWLECLYTAIGMKSPWRLVDFDAIYAALAQFASIGDIQAATIAIKGPAKLADAASRRRRRSTPEQNRARNRRSDFSRQFPSKRQAMKPVLWNLDQQSSIYDTRPNR